MGFLTQVSPDLDGLSSAEEIPLLDLGAGEKPVLGGVAAAHADGPGELLLPFTLTWRGP